jgi:hypothetical protein
MKFYAEQNKMNIEKRIEESREWDRNTRRAVCCGWSAVVFFSSLEDFSTL